MKRRYTKRSDGEPIDIALRKFKGDPGATGRFWMECCDCGLRHLLTFMVVKGFIIMRAWRDQCK